MELTPTDVLLLFLVLLGLGLLALGIAAYRMFRDFVEQENRRRIHELGDIVYPKNTAVLAVLPDGRTEILIPDSVSDRAHGEKVAALAYFGSRLDDAAWRQATVATARDLGPRDPA